MLKHALLLTVIGAMATFTAQDASAFGHHWRRHHHNSCSGYTSGYGYGGYTTSGYSSYRPALRSAVQYPRAAMTGYGRYRNYGYNSGYYNRGYSGMYGYGLRGNTGLGFGYGTRGYGSASLMGLGNGYYYGGFPSYRAAGIGLNVGLRPFMW